MGQHQSQSARGIPSLVTSATDVSTDAPFPGLSDQHPPASSTPSSTGSAVNNMAAIAVDQSQSVRSVIDSFIETCLAGSDDGYSGSSEGQTVSEHSTSQASQGRGHCSSQASAGHGGPSFSSAQPPSGHSSSQGSNSHSGQSFSSAQPSSGHSSSQGSNSHSGPSFSSGQPASGQSSSQASSGQGFTSGQSASGHSSSQGSGGPGFGGGQPGSGHTNTHTTYSTMSAAGHPASHPSASHGSSSGMSGHPGRHHPSGHLSVHPGTHHPSGHPSGRSGHLTGPSGYPAGPSAHPGGHPSAPSGHPGGFSSRPSDPAGPSAHPGGHQPGGHLNVQGSSQPVGKATASGSVEVITVPDEDDADDVNVDTVRHDNAAGGGGERNSAKTAGGEGERERNSAETCEGQDKKEEVIHDKNTAAAEEKKCDPILKDARGHSDKDSDPSIASKECVDVKPVPMSKPFQSANLGSERLESVESKPTPPSCDSSNSSTDGMESVRLKTLIDRVLDNSLGAGMDCSTVPIEKRILPQITTEENANAALKSEKTQKEGESPVHKTPSEKNRAPATKVDPMAICFMEHIEKAVERSFSSITEEEERKEKEKVLATQAKREPSDTKNSSWPPDAKNSSWSVRTSKPSEPASQPPVSNAEGTICVQDIVDLVINQSEMVSRQGGSVPSVPSQSQHTDGRPMVSASGTFYPDRPAVDQTSHASQAVRRDVHKEEVPRENTGRRGRPRMRSPCPERREPGQEYGASSREMGHRDAGPREGIPHREMGLRGGENYLQSIQAMTQFGQVAAPHRMPPFLPAPMVTSASATQNSHPMVSAQNAMVMAAVGGLHHPHSPHQPRLHPPPSSALASQPPPLLRVDGMERGERKHHPQQKSAPPSHPPSRICPCSVCAMFFARERETERARMIQQPGAIPRMPVHPAHPAYQPKTITAPSHPAKWPSADLRHVEGRHLEPKPEKPFPHYPYARGQEAYPASHPAYGIQTGVPVPAMAYPDKSGPDARHPDPHYSRDRAEHPHRLAKAGYEEGVAREMGPRHHYPANVPPRKHTVTPPHPHHPQLGASSVTTRKEDPLLDLTHRREVASSGPRFVEDEKPLDLSSKKSSSPAFMYERQDARHHREDDHRRDMASTEVDAHGRAVYGERSREGDKYMPASQHLHNLETSVESHFQKLQHVGQRAGPMHNMSVNMTHPGFAGAMHPHASPTAGPPQSVGRPVAGPVRGNGVPLPPHHPTLPPSHPSPGVSHPGFGSASQPASSYPAEPLLSPGSRRPQLHPIPAPNPSTTLGSAAPRPALPYQRTAGSSGAMAPTGSAAPSGPSSSSPVAPSHSMVSPMSGGVSGGSLSGSSSSPVVPAAASSPQHSSSGSLTPSAPEYGRLSGSRSASPPPANDLRGDDRRRGSVSKHEPLQSILGNHNPQDILYLICRLCRQTYGSSYSFRKHFRNQHGFEPKAEHTLVQTISATKNARQMSGGIGMDPESPSFDASQPGKASSVDGYSSHTSSPRPDMMRAANAERPGSAVSEAVSEPYVNEGPDKQGSSVSRASTDSKSRSPSGSASTGSVGEEREDTKYLECPECGQTFQLNDFGSYKRHCRQHGQMKGVAREGGGGPQSVFICAECQCSFSEHHLLQEHMQRHQTGAIPVVCSLCRGSFPSSADYSEHMHTAHSSCKEPASSSSPGMRGKVTSASCDISSSTVVRRETATMSMADSSVFNLTVTTPSNLEICRLPADPTVTSASPDSSSDNKKDEGKKGQEGSPVTCSSSSEPSKTGVKTDASSSGSPKPASPDGPDLSKPGLDNKEKSDTDDKTLVSSDKYNSVSLASSSASSLDVDDNPDMFMYKHKKFSAHRKRSASNASETTASESKQSRLDTSTPKTEKTQQNFVSSATGKPGKSLDANSKTGEDKAESVPSKTEARHPLPFVWDRVTRSQAGKNARASD